MHKAINYSVAFCLVLIGCSAAQFIANDRWRMTEQHEGGYSNSGDAWVGHQVEELVDDLGQPEIVLEARPRFFPFKDGVRAFSYIYYGETNAGRRCIDAFVVAEETGTIIKYYCR